MAESDNILTKVHALASPQQTWCARLALVSAAVGLLMLLGGTTASADVAQDDSPDFALDTRATVPGVGGVAYADSPDFTLDTLDTLPGVGGVAYADSPDFTLDTLDTLPGVGGVAYADSPNFTLDTRGTIGGGETGYADSPDFTLDTGGSRVTCPNNLVAECAGALTPVSFNVTGLDIGGAPLPVTCVPPSGSAFSLGTSTVTCSGTDTAGQVRSCSFTVTVMDTTPPQVTCPGNITVQTTNAAGAVVNYLASASDLCGVSDLHCSPPAGTVFPIGTTTAVCTAVDGSSNSSSCSFQVAVLGARGIKLDCLTNLITLRAGVTNRHDGDELDDAIEHLTKSLDSTLWIDQAHLHRKGGDKVFEEEKKAVHELVELLKDKKSTVTPAALHELIDCILRADRMLAVVAVDEAEAAGVKPKKIAEDRKEIDKGDEDAARGKYEEAINHYRNAWKHAVHIKIDPPHRLVTGGARLAFIGIEGETYVIQASSDLTNWITIGTAKANADGEVALDDPGASGQTSRFYRVVSP